MCLICSHKLLHVVKWHQATVGHNHHRNKNNLALTILFEITNQFIGHVLRLGKRTTTDNRIIYSLIVVEVLGVIWLIRVLIKLWHAAKNLHLLHFFVRLGRLNSKNLCRITIYHVSEVLLPKFIRVLCFWVVITSEILDTLLNHA